jgi:hypothetical protein
MFLNEYSIVKIITLTANYWLNSLNAIFIQLFKKKEAQAMGKSFLDNIPPTYVRKVRLRVLPGPRCWPYGQPGSQAS